jgi:hypothetical protein
MTADEKLAAILAAVQTDPGNRGLARVPGDNLFTACPGDFAAACHDLATAPFLSLVVVTGFYIPTADPPAFETDGPLGAAFLIRALLQLGAEAILLTEHELRGVFGHAGIEDPLRRWVAGRIPPAEYSDAALLAPHSALRNGPPTHVIAVERVGPNGNGRCHSMRGRDVTEYTEPAARLFRIYHEIDPRTRTIGIGDGGNEIGMGKIPHETVVANIPNGDLIHCRVPTDHLIVAGVSNWGAYALAAGVFVLRGVRPPADLFDPDRERAILDVMVREGPLVDGVTGKQTATVDGLSWEEYARPLVRIREILEM